MSRSPSSLSPREMANHTVNACLRLTAVGGAAALCLSSETFAHRLRAGVTSATQIVSPVAAVTWVTYPQHSDQLALLVLWRGKPGWFLRRSESRTASVGGDDAEFTTTAKYGGIQLDLTIQWATNIARVQGKAVEISHGNVIFVDNIDDLHGANVVGTSSISPELPIPMRIEAALRRSREIIAFLRCDLRLDNPRTQAVFDKLCGELVGKLEGG